MASQKFHAVPLGPEPIVCSSDAPHLASKTVMAAAHEHLRRHGVVTPPLTIPAKVLSTNTTLFQGAAELSGLYEKAVSESLTSPTVTAIQGQTSEFAASLGLTQTQAPRPGMSFPSKTRPGAPAMK